MPHSRWVQHDSKGFLLIMTLLTLTGLATLTTISLARSATDLMAANRAVAKAQALYAAEAGLDAVTWENRRSGWLFLTHDALGNRASPPPRPALGGTTIDPRSGNYVVSVAAQTAAVQAAPHPTNPTLVRLSATGVSGLGQEQVEAFMQPASLLDYAFFFPDSAQIYWGQRVAVEGGSGLIHVEGDLTLYGGNYSPASWKEVSLQGRDINIYGAFIRRRQSNYNAPVTVKNTTTGQTKETPLPPSNTSFRSTDNNTTTNPQYWNWLTTAPDFRGFLKEITTGATSFTSVMPTLPDIDTFVGRFLPRASIIVDSLSDVDNLLVPCPAAWRTVSFANASTLQVVQAAELDVDVLNFCNSTNEPIIIYSRVPIRLIDGSQLDAGLTVAGEDAVYVKGNFNVVAPKPAAVATANRVYHISETFRDYTRFIDRSDEPARPTLADAIQFYDPDNDDFSGDRGDYDLFISKYGDPRTGNTLPPFPHWMTLAQDSSTTRDATMTQRMAIVAPMGRYPVDHRDGLGNPDGGQVITDDHALVPRYGVMENWGGVGCNSGCVYQVADPDNNGTPNRELHRYGAFTNLPDNDPYQLPNGSPQDHRAMRDNKKFLSGSRVNTGATRWWNIYEEFLSNDPPPGFGEAEQTTRQVYWDYMSRVGGGNEDAVIEPDPGEDLCRKQVGQPRQPGCIPGR